MSWNAGGLCCRNVRRRRKKLLRFGRYLRRASLIVLENGAVFGDIMECSWRPVPFLFARGTRGQRRH
eukprot:2881023-Pyramimonas_sp.AAC.1